jgi:hypothetical protein
MVKKTSKGGYADYTTSTWARKETSLSAEELAAVESSLHNLSTFLPKKPTAEELVIMKEMFEASVDGQAYDPDKWGKYFRPSGVNIPGLGGNNAQTEAAKPAAPAAKPAPVAAAKPAVVEDDDIPFDVDEAPAASAPVQTPTAQGSRAEDIIAMIRNRNKSA